LLTAPGARQRAALIVLQTSDTRCARCAVLGLGRGMVGAPPPLASQWNDVVLGRQSSQRAQDRRLDQPDVAGVDLIVMEFLRTPDLGSLREIVRVLAPAP
jgi:hypothetical protein